MTAINPLLLMPPHRTPKPSQFNSDTKNPEKIEGSLSILTRTSGKVGTDCYYDFKNVIQIDGKPLCTSTNDLIYFVQIAIPQSGGEIEYKQIELPSALFEQARRENRVCFTLREKNYVLTLASHLHGFNKSFKEISFDDCVRGIKKDQETSLVEFLHECDVPESYFLWTRESEVAQFLSPQTKRISLEKPGTEPLNFEELEYFASDSKSYKPLHMYEDKERCVIQFAACGKPSVDILLDRRNLIVHIANTSENSWLGKHLFSRIMIPNPSKTIDESKITASMSNTGILTVIIPLLKSVQEEDAPIRFASEPTQENFLSSSSQAAKVSIDTRTAVPATKISVRYDAGFGNTLFLRGEGAEFLSWGEPRGLEMKCIESDLWALEFNQTDFKNLKYKVLINDTQWEKGNDHEIQQGQQQEIVPRF